MKRTAFFGTLICLGIFYISGCADHESPRILDVTALQNTIDSVGPYEVVVSTSDDRDIRSVYLYFGSGDEDTPEAEMARREMEKITEESYRAEIPGFPPGTLVIYFVVVQDNEGNKDRIPSEGYLDFRILVDE